MNYQRLFQAGLRDMLSLYGKGADWCSVGNSLSHS